jgi:hypothetical protein
MQSGKRGSSPRENISYNVTPYDHTSERAENFPSRRLSGAYLHKVNRLKDYTLLFYNTMT